MTCMATPRGTSKIKKSWNLPVEVVQQVRDLVEVHHAAPTQDALVARAIQEFARQLQEEIDTRLWADAARDPEFIAQSAQLDREFPLTFEAWE